MAAVLRNRTRSARALSTITWQVGANRVLNLEKPTLMGILNVTPDSFSDGGRYVEFNAAVEHARRLIDEGASLIDVGGESTRPGAHRVTEEEQCRRVLPIIERLRAIDTHVLLSIDTTLGRVARRAIEAGANIINDVAAGTEDHSILELAATHRVGIILMHRVNAPDSDVYSDQYSSAPMRGDVVHSVRTFLAERRQAAIDCGVEPSQIVLDPGLGFGKTVEQNFELMARVNELLALGHPVLGAASRKSFLGRVAGSSEPANRDAGSVAAAICLFQRGVRLFRVHDVEGHRQSLSVAAAVSGAVVPMYPGAG